MEWLSVVNILVIPLLVYIIKLEKRITEMEVKLELIFDMVKEVKKGEV